MTVNFLGIDISKKDFHVVLITGETRTKSRKFTKQQQDLIKQLISDHFDKHPELKQQRDLLVSIPGIGAQTAAVLLSEIGSIADDRNARQLAAHAGLTPCERTSGTSVHGKTKVVLYWQFSVP